MISMVCFSRSTRNKGNTTCTRAVERLLVCGTAFRAPENSPTTPRDLLSIAESNGSLHIILRNEANDLFEFFERLREQRLFSSPSTDFLADAFEGNALPGIKFGSSLVETRE